MSGSTRQTEYEFSIPSKPKEPDPTPPIKFKIHNGEFDEHFAIRRPKLAIAMGMVQLTEQRDQHTAVDFGLKLSHLMWSFVAYVLPEPPEPDEVPSDPDDPTSKLVPNPHAGMLRGRGRLYQRLNDPADEMDILDLEPMFQQMVHAMFNRPTGPSPESESQSGDGATDSEEATPAKPAKTAKNSRRTSTSTPQRTTSAKATKRASRTVTAAPSPSTESS